MRAMGIRDKPTAGLTLARMALRTADRIFRHECIDMFIIRGEAHCVGFCERTANVLQSCFITPICLCDWREEVLLIWNCDFPVGLILVLPRDEDARG